MADIFKIIDSSPKGIYVEIKASTKSKILTYPVEFSEEQILRSIHSEIEKLKENNSHSLFSKSNAGQEVELTRTEVERPIDLESGLPIGAKEYRFNTILKGKK